MIPFLVILCVEVALVALVIWLIDWWQAPGEEEIETDLQSPEDSR